MSALDSSEGLVVPGDVDMRLGVPGRMTKTEGGVSGVGGPGPRRRQRTMTTPNLPHVPLVGGVGPVVPPGTVAIVWTPRPCLILGPGRRRAGASVPRRVGGQVGAGRSGGKALLPVGYIRDQSQVGTAATRRTGTRSGGAGVKGADS